MTPRVLAGLVRRRLEREPDLEVTSWALPFKERIEARSGPVDRFLTIRPRWGLARRFCQASIDLNPKADHTQLRWRFQELTERRPIRAAAWGVFAVVFNVVPLLIYGFDGPLGWLRVAFGLISLPAIVLGGLALRHGGQAWVDRTQVGFEDRVKALLDDVVDAARSLPGERGQLSVASPTRDHGELSVPEPVSPRAKQ